jgi:hypothetical protein
VMPGRGLARRQPLPPNQVVPAMMQYLLIRHKVYSLSLFRPPVTRCVIPFARNALHISGTASSILGSHYVGLCEPFDQKSESKYMVREHGQNGL